MRTYSIGICTLMALVVAACTEGGDPVPMDHCEGGECMPLDSGPAPDEDSGEPEPGESDEGGMPSDDGGSGEAPSAGLPCEVLDVLAKNCLDCHGDPPAYGAPMPLVDHDDMHIPSTTVPTEKVAERVAARLLDEVNPMPPGGAMDPAERDLLLAWIDEGAPEDPAADCEAPMDDEEPPTGPDALPCEPDVVFTAHELGSDAPFAVPEQGADNMYVCFAFKAPFDADTHATAWAPIIDDERVVHHWILYRTKLPQEHGGVVACDVTLQLGTQFVAGWAPGGGNVVMPDDVGLDLGGPDDWYLLQLHYNNVAHYDDALDRSGVAFCTADAPREKTAGILTLGSIGITIPPLVEDYDVTGTCAPWTTLLWPELHLMGASPHMHELGRAVHSEIHRLDGTKETMLDVPMFDFNSQGMHTFDPEIVVRPGDTITTTCTYDNPNPWPVLFGEGTNDEMCFDFVLAYPIDGLLDRNCGILP